MILFNKYLFDTLDFPYVSDTTHRPPASRAYSVRARQRQKPSERADPIDSAGLLSPAHLLDHVPHGVRGEWPDVRVGELARACTVGGRADLVALLP